MAKWRTCCRAATPCSRRGSTSGCILPRRPVSTTGRLPPGSSDTRRRKRPGVQGKSMKTQLLAALLALSITAPVFAAITESPVTYNDGETTMKGFVVYDTANKGKRPGIIMVHEWWGITKHMHNEAHRLARQGYTTFIADMYGDGKTADNPNDAGALSGSVMKNPQAMESRSSAAREQLAKQPTVDSTRIGAVGYCFGGAVVLNMARAAADLAGVVGFHASLGLNTPAPAPGTVKAKILVLNGAADPFVKREEYATLKAGRLAPDSVTRVHRGPWRNMDSRARGRSLAPAIGVSLPESGLRLSPRSRDSTSEARRRRRARFHRHSSGGPMKHYIDAVVIPVPRASLDTYKRMSEEWGKAHLRHGALYYSDSISDDAQPGKLTSFPQA